MLTIEEYNEICDTHEEESTWYFFLNYGDPLHGSNPEYAAKHKAVAKALGEYCKFMESQQKVLETDRDCNL